jgi:hypothetical protein
MEVAHVDNACASAWKCVLLAPTPRSLVQGYPAPTFVPRVLPNELGMPRTERRAVSSGLTWGSHSGISCRWRTASDDARTL